MKKFKQKSYKVNGRRRNKSHKVNGRRINMEYVSLSRAAAPSGPQPVSVPEDNGIIIFKSELDYISRCILDRKNIETGGQLFGYWSGDGRPIVMYAIGPGPKANHQKTFFNQDVEYLVKVGRFLKENFGLHHIGEWHSHHQLGLDKPSYHDVNTMISTIREKGLGKFLLCIGNCNATASSLKGYLCGNTVCMAKEWDVIYSQSPIRREADAKLNGILRHPLTRYASHIDVSLNEGKSSEPKFAEGYWLKQRGNGVILNDIMNYLKHKHPYTEVNAQMNPAGEAVLIVKTSRFKENILFPGGFPNCAPRINRYQENERIASSNPDDWQYVNGNITGSFIHFYETI